jgi:hypothetical protein
MSRTGIGQSAPTRANVIEIGMLALLALLAAAPDATAANTAANNAAKHLKVLVLDVNSSVMDESEKTTLTNLEAAHLSEDTRLEVLSGEDLRQLVKLQGQAAELGVGGNCTDACMAELAGALGAGVVIATQAGKLGETLVVTLAVFDAAQAKSVSRRSIQAQSLGELPAKMGPALDALVTPLLPGGLHHDPEAAPLPVAAAQTVPAPATSTSVTTTNPPPPPPPSSGAHEAPAAPAAPASDSSDDTLLWVLLGVGAAVGLAVLVVVLLTATNGSNGSGGGI